MQKIGTVLVVLGLLIFIITGALKFLFLVFTQQIPFFIKLGVVLLLLGIILLFFDSYSKHDKYERIKR